MTSSVRKQGRVMVVVILCYLAIAAVMNLLVNPLRMAPVSCSLAALEPYRDISRDVRTGKAGLVRYHRDVEVAIVGSSRFEIGLDPCQPAFKGAKTLNLAMAAGSLHESIAMVRYLMERQPKLRQLIFGLELGDLSSDADSRTFTSFYTSPLADSAGSLDREIQHIVGITALEESLATLSRAIRHAESSRTTFGLWLAPGTQPDLRVFLKNNRDVIFARGPDMYELRSQRLRKDKLDKLKSLLLELRRRGVQVSLTIPPELALKQVHPSLIDIKTAPWSVDRRGIYDLCLEVNRINIPNGPPVALWDFNTFNPQTSVALPSESAASRQLPHWYDMGHFDVAIGRLMVEQIMGSNLPSNPPPLPERFGVNVLAIGLEAHLEGLRLGHARYCREHPDDVAWARSILPAMNSKPVNIRSGDGLGTE